MMENATPKVARKMITTKFLAIFSDKILVVSMAFALGSIAADVCARCDSFSIHNTPHWREAPAPKYLVLSCFLLFVLTLGGVLVYVYVI